MCDTTPGREEANRNLKNRKIKSRGQIATEGIISDARLIWKNMEVKETGLSELFEEGAR